MKRFRLIATLAVVALANACGQKPVETPQDFQEVFAENKALKTTAPEVQPMVNAAVTALESKDEATAVMTLRDLRSNPALNEGQVKAVEDMMKRAYLDLYERAARGDQRASAQLQLLNMNPQ